MRRSRSRPLQGGVVTRVRRDSSRGAAGSLSGDRAWLPGSAASACARQGGDAAPKGFGAQRRFRLGYAGTPPQGTAGCPRARWRDVRYAYTFLRETAAAAAACVRKGLAPPSDQDAGFGNACRTASEAATGFPPGYGEPLHRGPQDAPSGSRGRVSLSALRFPCAGPAAEGDTKCRRPHTQPRGSARVAGFGYPGPAASARVSVHGVG